MPWARAIRPIAAAGLTRPPLKPFVQRRLQTVRTPAERDIGRVDREREHVEDDFAGSRRADVGNVGTARDLGGRAVPIDEDGFLHRFQPIQSQTARPMTSSRSRPRSHGSSSVNSVTHWRHGQGMRVMSVPQNQRAGPKAS